MFHSFSKDEDERNIAPLSKNGTRFFSAIAGSLTFFDTKTSKIVETIDADVPKANLAETTADLPLGLPLAG